MNMRIRAFLESEVFGREYFDEVESVESKIRDLIASATKQTAQDGETRRVGIEVSTVDPDWDDIGAELPKEVRP